MGLTLKGWNLLQEKLLQKQILSFKSSKHGHEKFSSVKKKEVNDLYPLCNLVCGFLFASLEYEGPAKNGVKLLLELPPSKNTGCNIFFHILQM